MASVAEPAFLSEQAKKEEKNRKREAKNRALEEEKRRKKEEEERQKREKELQAIANFRNNGQSNKQAPRIPAKPAVALAKPQPQAMKAPVKAAQAPLPVVAPAKTTVPTSTTHASSVQSAPVAWAKVVPKSTNNVATVPSLPIASGKPLTDASKVSNLDQYQQQPATTRSTEMTFYVGQIPVNSTGKANIMFGRKETKTTTVVKTQAPVVETQASTVVEKTQTTTVVMNYASALQNKDAEAQKTLGTYNVAAATSVSVTTSVTTTLPVVPQTNQPAKAVVPQTNQPAKAVVSQTNQPSKAAVSQTNQPAKEKVVVPATKTTNGQKGPVKSYYNGTQNGPDQKNNGTGRVTNGSGKGSSQKYYNNGSGQRYNANGSGHANGSGQRYNANGSGHANGYGQRYNGNNGQRYTGYGNGQKYYGNGRFNNGRQENQKKQPKPEPVIDEDGFQLVVNRRRPGKIHVTE